jgi:hypothetical protein
VVITESRETSLSECDKSDNRANDLNSAHQASVRCTSDTSEWRAVLAPMVENSRRVAGYRREGGGSNPGEGNYLHCIQGQIANSGQSVFHD